MIPSVPATGLSVPSVMSMVASTGLVDAVPVSTQRQNLLVDAVMVESDGSVLSNSTRLLPVSMVVVTEARVTVVVPEATEAEISEKYWSVPEFGVYDVAMKDSLGVPNARIASSCISRAFKCSVDAMIIYY